MTDLRQRLADKQALITGAGSGIGRASAIRMAAEGAAVMCADLDTQAAEGTVALINENGGATTVGIEAKPSAAAQNATSDGLDYIELGHTDASIVEGILHGNTLASLLTMRIAVMRLVKIVLPLRMLRRGSTRAATHL